MICAGSKYELRERFFALWHDVGLMYELGMSQGWRDMSLKYELKMSISA